MKRIVFPVCGGEHDNESISGKGCGECQADTRWQFEGRRAAARRQGMRVLEILVGLVAVIGLIACQKQEQSGPVGMKFVLIPAGSFMMGSDSGNSDEKPVHRVTISRAFQMQTTEVTQGQWRAVMGDNPSEFKNGDDYPVEHVSWDDAQEFLKRLNQLDPGKNYRLPTEAEWEYACRAGTTGERYGELHAIAWYRDNSNARTHPVGKKQPNAWGLYDMLGNVWEWCADWYDEDYYSSSPSTDPRGPSSGQDRVLRGGSWNCNDYYVRSAYRGGYNPDVRYGPYGFRCTRD